MSATAVRVFSVTTRHAGCHMIYCIISHSLVFRPPRPRGSGSWPGPSSDTGVGRGETRNDERAMHCHTAHHTMVNNRTWSGCEAVVSALARIKTRIDVRVLACRKVSPAIRGRIFECPPNPPCSVDASYQCRTTVYVPSIESFHGARQGSRGGC